MSKLAELNITASGQVFGLAGPASSLVDLTFTLTDPGAVFLKSSGEVELLSDGKLLDGTSAGTTTPTLSTFSLPAGMYQIKGLAEAAEGMSASFALELTVPEPATLMLSGVGLLLLGLAAVRHDRAWRARSRSCGFTATRAGTPRSRTACGPIIWTFVPCGQQITWSVARTAREQYPFLPARWRCDRGLPSPAAASNPVRQASEHCHESQLADSGQ